MRINNNLMAMNTHRQLGIGTNNGAKSMEKLSSGFRINRAGDDAAGLAISEKMRGQIRGLNQASRNAQDAISLIQTAEGALSETHAILQRMRELAVQASTDTNTDVDRAEIQAEINQLTDEVDRIANTTQFNTQNLLDGSKEGLVVARDSTITLQNNSSVKFDIGDGVTNVGTSASITITQTGSGASGLSINTVGGPDATVTGATISFDGVSIGLGVNAASMAAGESVTITINKKVDAKNDPTNSLSMQIGANTGQNIWVGINSMKAEDLDVRGSDGKALDVEDRDNATGAISLYSSAIETVSAERAKLGAIQNRLEYTIKNLDTSSENLQAAESRVRDVDMAKEMMELTKNNILKQASTAMLAQANQSPQSVLQLLG